jgi:hypothetical protein
MGVLSSCAIELLGQSMHRKKVNDIIIWSQFKAGSRCGVRSLADTPALAVGAGRG